MFGPFFQLVNHLVLSFGPSRMMFGVIPRVFVAKALCSVVPFLKPFQVDALAETCQLGKRLARNDDDDDADDAGGGAAAAGNGDGDGDDDLVIITSPSRRYVS
jgi:hypothetical protein